MDTTRSLRATSLALAIASTAVGVSSATAKTVFPPVAVGGSVADRVMDIYRSAPATPGYYATVLRHGNAYDGFGSLSRR